MQKRTVTIQLPAITAEWLKEHLTSPAILPLAIKAEDELQMQILSTLLTSALGGSHEPSNQNR